MGQGPPYRRIATTIGCASAHRFGLAIRGGLALHLHRRENEQPHPVFPRRGRRTLTLTVGQGPPYRRIATIIGCASAHRFGLVIHGGGLLCTGGKTGDPTPPMERAPDFGFNGGPRPTLQADCDNHRVRLGAPLRPCHPRGLLCTGGKTDALTPAFPRERAPDVGFNGGQGPPYRRIATTIGCASAHHSQYLLRVIIFVDYR